MCVAILRFLRLVINDMSIGMKWRDWTLSSVTSGQLTMTSFYKLERSNFFNTGKSFSFILVSKFKSRARSNKIADDISNFAYYLTSVFEPLSFRICNFWRQGKAFIMEQTLIGLQKLPFAIIRLDRIGEDPKPSKGVIEKVISCWFSMQRCNS